MSTEMESVKAYTDVVCADLRNRMRSAERLSQSLKVDLTVAIPIEMAKNIAHLLSECTAIAARLERVVEIEQSRADAAERSAASSIALLEELKLASPKVILNFFANWKAKL